jgi:hypothetical protein
VPIDQDALARHIAEHGPYLFHVTNAANQGAIAREGLRPGSDLGRYIRDDFFRTRPGHVYICDARRGVPVVPVEGERLMLQVDLRRLDPACFDTDEDVPRHQEIFQGNPWFSVPTPPLKQLEDGSQAPGQDGALASWAESIDEFDEPEFVARSLAAGRIAYRGTVPPEALEGVELPSEVIGAFIGGAREALSDGDLGPVPALAFNDVEADRALALAQQMLDVGLRALDRPPLSSENDLSDPMNAYYVADDIRRFGYERNRKGDFERRDLAFAIADLARAVYDFDRSLGWDSDACRTIGEQAVACLPRLAAVAGAERAGAAAREAIVRAGTVGA